MRLAYFSLIIGIAASAFIGCSASQLSKWEAYKPTLANDAMATAITIPSAVAGNPAPLGVSLWNMASHAITAVGGIGGTIVYKKARRAGKQERRSDRTGSPPSTPPPAAPLSFLPQTLDTIPAGKRLACLPTGKAA